MTIYIDNAARKKIVTFWIPACLTFLHMWGCVLIYAITFGDKTNMDGETVRLMFSSCITGIGCLILLLISDKAVEFVIERLTGPLAGRLVEQTTTQTTKTTPIVPVENQTTTVQDGQTTASGTENGAS